MKNPFVAGAINFILPGLGYLILGRRVVFGWLLFASTILGMVCLYLFPKPTAPIESSEGLLFTALFLLMSFAFGYDAYQEAKRRN